MSFTLIELYSPRAAWLSLDAEGRNEVFARIGAGMGGVLAFGVEPIAFGAVDSAVPRAPDALFFGAWRAPDRAALDALVAGIATTGWHDYFETVNAGGETVDLTAHLGQLAAA